MIFSSWEGMDGRRGGREHKDTFWQGLCPRLVMRRYGGMGEHERQEGCEVVVARLYEGVRENKAGTGVSHGFSVGGQRVPFCEGRELLGVRAVLFGGREGGKGERVVGGCPQQRLYRGHPSSRCWLIGRCVPHKSRRKIVETKGTPHLERIDAMTWKMGYGT